MNLSKENIFSIMESLFFMSSEPRSFSDLENLFKENQISTEELKSLLEEFKTSYEQKYRGIQLEKTKKGWFFKTKVQNKKHLLKLKPQNTFRLSKPSLEVLAIIAFEQPCTKGHIEEIRGVESTHLLKTLMEKGLICIAGQSPLPGKASTYKTSLKFLEVFGFESLKALPSLKEIEDLLPESQKQEPEKPLQSISKIFDQKPIPYSLDEDEKENQKIKENLKELPVHPENLKNKTKEKNK